MQGLDQAGAGRQARARALADRKDAMDQKVGDLQQQLEKLANEMRANEKDAARKLDEAAGSIRDRRVREKIRYSKGTLSQGTEYARAMEDDIASNLDALQKKIGEAAAAMGQSKKADALARAADKARDLVRGMESAQKNRGSQGSKGSQGSQRSQGSEQRGQQAQAGQQGQQGQQGRQGQPGQEQNAQAVPGGGGRSNGSPLGGAPGRLTPDDVRQMRRQAREWEGDVQQLRQQLQAAGVNPKDLDQIMRDLAALDSDRAYADPKGLAELQAAALEHLKKFEFQLRKQVESGNDSLAL